jgi:hypothetical protein
MDGRAAKRSRQKPKSKLNFDSIKLKTNNNKNNSNKSTSSLEKLDYNEYIMDKALLAIDQMNTKNIDDYEDEENYYSNMSGNVSYKEFMHQYNELKRWIDRLQSFNNDTESMSSYCEKYTKQVLNLFYSFKKTSSAGIC